MSEPDAPERRRPHRSASGIEVEPVYGPSDLKDFDPATALGEPGRLPVYPGHPPRWLPRPAMDDAPVRGIRLGGGDEPPLPLPPRARPDRPLGRLRSAHPDGLRLGRPDGRRRGRAHRRADRLDRRHGAPPRRDRPRRGLHLDDDQRHRRHPADALRDGGAAPRRRPARAPRHDPERHPQGVHRARDLHLPARTLDAARDGHVRLLPDRAAGLEHDQHQRLPHARGRSDGDPGGRVHGRQRDRLCRCRDRRGPGLRRIRAAPLLLLRRPRRPPRRGREVPCRPAHVGDGRARPLRGEGSEEHGHAVPRPDRRLDAHRPAAGRERRAHDGPGARRGPRRDAVAAHERPRRGARAADALDRAARAPNSTSVVSRGRGRGDRRPAGGLVLRRDPDRDDPPRRDGGARPHRRSRWHARRPRGRLPARCDRRRRVRRAAGRSRRGTGSSSASTPSPTRARSSDPRRSASTRTSSGARSSEPTPCALAATRSPRPRRWQR